MKNRFQLVLSFSVFGILFLGFFAYSIWVEGIIFKNLKNQALKDNLTIGETVLDMLDKSGVNSSNKIEFVKLVQETCDVLKMPNDGYLCMMDSTGALLAAPGLTPSKEVKISKASFHSENRSEKFSFTEFFSIEPFTGYYEYETIGYSDIVVALTHKHSGYKLMVHQDANLIREQAKDKSKTILIVGWGFAIVISVLAYFVIRGQVKRYQFRIEIQNKQLAKVNNEIWDKNKVLKTQNAQLEELAEERNALLGIMAHDLKNPIGGIESVIRLVNSAGDLNPKQVEYFSLIESQMKSAQSLIEDVLEMNSAESNQDSFQKDKINLVDMLKSKMAVFQPLAQKKQIEIIEDYYSSEVWVETGVNELNRIIDNLFSNSIKYSPLSKKVILQLKNSGNTIKMGFIDEGMGIRKEELPKLFKKFSKLSARPTNEEASSGLGLYIVKILADKIGAQIEVESNYEQGSKFSIVLPVS